MTLYIDSTFEGDRMQGFSAFLEAFSLRQIQPAKDYQKLFSMEKNSV
jgi:hypothetical protein